MNWKYPLSAIALSALLVGCNQSENANKSASNETMETKEEAIIKDELNRKVTIPMNPDRVVVGGILPYFSTWYIATNSTQEIVGMHPNSYNAASHSILKDISPDILKADTSFIQNGEVNIEELMKVNPEVYFEIASDEKSINKLEEAGIPTVALQATADSDDPLEILNRWLTLTGEITGTTDRPDQIIQEGKKNQQEINDKLANVQKEDMPRVMILQYHNDKEISVAGSNMHGNRWIKATGGIDVAEADVQGIKAVNMEQIYNWDPDIIYITNFTETQPEDLFNNTIDGQDWSQLKAVKNKQVYKVPLGIYRWYPPNGDAPLMLKWMAQHNHPEIFDYNMTEEIKNYYTKFYNYNVTEEQIKDILNPSSEAAKY
ncbi:ABC transporter substrate-binding protein [Lysinibacillus sp. CD3-6]|uniref:ABC transporter substrate-binding protein n=1 Tax=Lysinibacillus sp. CD3-6 TaxID=2892541 RepID=UPI0011736C83|nr:ABC transporter substrate-binding protein [Lysinibacillus sp. CD3-6]UED81702.1 ABC transporter substrate-binding protein [Lysinibacillus sp. CD3-6]